MDDVHLLTAQHECHLVKTSGVQPWSHCIRFFWYRSPIKFMLAVTLVQFNRRTIFFGIVIVCSVPGALGAIHTSELDRSEIDLSPKRSE